LCPARGNGREVFKKSHEILKFHGSFFCFIAGESWTKPGVSWYVAPLALVAAKMKEDER
jgi:hypothetical protein